MKRIVTLLTDFGQIDPYVGIMKGVILGINPEINIIDITHGVQSFDVYAAGFLLANACEYFPPWTIHVVVVDPGVGGSRRPIMAATEDQYFVAPDNGVLSHVYHRYPHATVREITADHYFLTKRGATFDGRDVFAPCAAWLSKVQDSSVFGEIIEDYVRIEIPAPARKGSTIEGRVQHIDRFGNLITNIPGEMLDELRNLFQDTPPRVRFDGDLVIPLVDAYCDRSRGELLAVIGGTGFLEIAANQGNALEMLDKGVGAAIEVFFPR